VGSQWGEWAAQAEGSDDHWAYLYGLSYRRAELCLQLLDERLLKIDSQVAIIKVLEEQVRRLRTVNAEMAEDLEVARCQLEELDISA
jgi:hypothetical protein